MFLTSKNLETPAIAHGFFTRKGGVSVGIFATLNCGGRGMSDSAANVDENRRRVAEALGTSQLVSLHQVHGAKALFVDKPWDMETRPEADGMVTKTPGIALGILTADCVPVLFADKDAGVIGAAHAGWKGIVAGVLEETLALMEVHGARRSRIRSAIGPAIAHFSYEVGPELREAFVARNPDCGEFFTPSQRGGKFFFAIKAAVRHHLKQAGVRSINILENDTYMEEDDFFSFRRATHRGEPDYGRQISAIMLKER